MRLSSAIFTLMIALTVSTGLASAARADSGRIRFNVVKAGFVVGGSGGRGTLAFHGRYYPLAIGGGGGGVFFWASRTGFCGAVWNILTAAECRRVVGGCVG